MQKALITDIKRFAVHDGDGIRTTVFFKGCPLKCVWCHNPEGLMFEAQTAYFEHKCVSCGACVKACPQKAHTFENGNHAFIREKCGGCNKCVSVCTSEAMVHYGKEMTVDEILSVILVDRCFYEESGGGITLSGGECVCQADFCAELLEKCKREGIDTAVDTCGFVPRQSIEKVLPFTDTFLYDIKAMDEDVHIKCTGQSNGIILENLRYIDSLGKAIEVRIPFVPKYNDDQIGKIAEFLQGLKNIKKVKVLPYHNFAGSKYDALGIENTLPDELADMQAVERLNQMFER